MKCSISCGLSISTCSQTNKSPIKVQHKTQEDIHQLWNHGSTHCWRALLSVNEQATKYQPKLSRCDHEHSFAAGVRNLQRNVLFTLIVGKAMGLRGVRSNDVACDSSALGESQISLRRKVGFKELALINDFQRSLMMPSYSTFPLLGRSEGKASPPALFQAKGRRRFYQPTCN